MVLIPRGFVHSWNLKFGPCDLWGMPCVGAKGFPFAREDEGCGPREGLEVGRAGDIEACIGEERTGYISCAVARGCLLGEESVHG